MNTSIRCGEFFLECVKSLEERTVLEVWQEKEWKKNCIDEADGG